jgi:hypothetical protein
MPTNLLNIGMNSLGQPQMRPRRELISFNRQMMNDCRKLAQANPQPREAEGEI